MTEGHDPAAAWLESEGMAWPPAIGEHDERSRPGRPAGLLSWRDIVETAILTAVVSISVHTAVQSRQVEGSSMEPTPASGRRSAATSSCSTPGRSTRTSSSA